MRLDILAVNQDGPNAVLLFLRSDLKFRHEALASERWWPRHVYITIFASSSMARTLGAATVINALALPVCAGMPADCCATAAWRLGGARCL